MSELSLSLTPEPLSSYLAAVGLLRVLNEQLNPGITGAWESDHFTLHGVDEEQLVSFLLDDFAPTPVFSPWNKEGDPSQNSKTDQQLTTITESGLDRFEPYVETLAAWRDVSSTDGWINGDKGTRLILWRGSAPDSALAWIDASTVPSGDGPIYPPLLGSGGNDGRFEMARMLHGELVRLFITPKEMKKSAGWLRSALFAEAGPPLVNTTIGMYESDAAGTPNSAAQGSASSASNPWIIVLAYEGLVGFGSSVATRLGSARPPLVGSPFMVRAGRLGGESAEGEDVRGEFLAPLWPRHVGWTELRRLIAEGRLAWKGRPAANSLDAIRAVANLGSDRGIASFARHQIAQRNGQSYIASPLGRLAVRKVQGADLLGNIDPWIRTVRSLPASSVKAAVRRLEQAQVAVVQSGGTPLAYQAVLLALADVERVVGSSAEGRDKCVPFPMRRGGKPVLDGAGWITQIDDGTPEIQLAIALASLRDENLHGNDSTARPYPSVALALRGLAGSTPRPLWPRTDEARDPRAAAAWQAKDSAIVEILNFRLLTASELPDYEPLDQVREVSGRAGQVGSDMKPRAGYGLGRRVPLALVAQLLDGEVDMSRVLHLARAVSFLSEWPNQISASKIEANAKAPVDPWFAAVRLCLNASPLLLSTDTGEQHVTIPSRRRWARAIAGGDLKTVGEEAVRLLRRAQLTHLVDVQAINGRDRRALASALLLRLNDFDLAQLARVLGSPGLSVSSSNLVNSSMTPTRSKEH